MTEVRSFYGVLGIELPAWAHGNAAVRCFADAAAHAHDDRAPSCSVSLEHGAWCCFACGASGGAYDAALLRGHTPASAIELLIAHGLAERRATAAAPQALPSHLARVRAATPSDDVPGLECGEEDVKRWAQALHSPERRRWLAQLCRQRLWTVAAMRSLSLGYGRGRITIPIRDRDGALRGVLRYHPAARGPKMLAVRGTRLGLIPHPALEPSRQILLVEGPPDMIAARSRAWPAIAVPGASAWKPGWAQLLAGRTVIALMDADPAGRAAAVRIAADLQRVCHVRVVDLAPDRQDGFDLTDWLHHHPRPRRKRCTPSSSPKPTITP